MELIPAQIQEEDVHKLLALFVENGWEGYYPRDRKWYLTPQQIERALERGIRLQVLQPEPTEITK
jgi:hypothetical protein